MLWDRVHRLAERVQTYPWWQVAVELAVIWVLAYVVIRFVQGTRAAGALKSILLILVISTLLIRILGQHDAFQRLKFLYENFLTLVAITLIVVFQPELRRGLIRLGETPLLRRPGASKAGVVDAIVEACGFLSKARFGAIIVIDREREGSLKGIIEGGTPIHGRVSARLLQTIFFPGSALHDLAVIVRGGEVVAAGVQLPLADPGDMPDPNLGSRHRAAVGLSRECDALVIVVSEESGSISLAERGRLHRHLLPDRLRAELESRLARAPSSPAGGHSMHDSTANGALMENAHQPADLTDPRD